VCQAEVDGLHNTMLTEHSLIATRKIKALSFSRNLSTAAGVQIVVLCDVAPCALEMYINFYPEKGGSIFKEKLVYTSKSVMYHRSEDQNPNGDSNYKVQDVKA
jgi:hypothetical protein